ncbi:pyridoxine/pyridoxamine 5'-phosphate oxidase [Actinoplanes sp. HUAS TT8]|uniref:pyridoxine/pyridoxamine 5'-phosphate oxidase n=1 Tax=Actinoplanes sp. HUAS TT8 TaxID=3447453 RepID=UPI003F524DD0
MSISWLLRTLPAMTGEMARFDLDRTPDEPHELFLRWFGEAVGAGVSEPHAMNLATVDDQGLPDVRVLLLREVDERGWHFAGDRRSAKGRQLAARPDAALGFYWREQGRQVRVRGKVFDLGLAASAADFLSRSPSARLAALSSVQSDVLPGESDLTLARHEAERLLAADPDFVPESHAVYAVVPISVEFWQGDPASRRHPRLRYRRAAESWVKELLWP